MVLLVVFMLGSFGDALAEPQGFAQRASPRAAPQGFGIESTTPNTVKGVIHNAHKDDYVVLEGRFIAEQTSSGVVYRFADASGDMIDVDISKSANDSLPLNDVNYYLWGVIDRDFFDITIRVIEFTPMV